ncbi:MAG TPA: alpha/beta hydrolase domain-containing protein [Gemmataceae bacterium]|nr:alpha/beta hydrolase domain-containing protein [Gemmataceae bacterium]
MRRIVAFLAIFTALSSVGAARAEVVALQIVKREPFAGGKAFGDVGPYDQITAIARFAVDPRDPGNRVIVDLDLAPKNADGKVEFASDVVILVPKDLTRANGAILYDVNNRGNKLALGMFNRPPGGPGPDAKNPAGDGFLMRKGYTIVWSGWIGELLPGDGRLLLQAPQAHINGELVKGIVRHETSADSNVKSMQLSRRPNHGSYPPTKDGEAKAVLTKRLHEKDKRVEVPRDKWRLVRMPLREVKDRVAGTLPEIRLEIEGGFEPGWLYEINYEGEGSLVQGLGLASVRDLILFLRSDKSDKNPLAGAGKSAIHRALCFGVSQSGRFQRQFLYDGFNEDAQGRIVFDGLMPHVAGGGLGFFNHRFAQPNRHNGQHEDHLYPADVFPFTYGPSIDPFTKKTDSILGRYAKSKVQPKIMHTQSAAEYWHRAGSLVHTDPLGTKDADIPDNVRIYSFGGTQHGPAAFPPGKGNSDNYANFGDYRPLLRGLITALDDWVREDKAPPGSLYPHIADGTLVEPTAKAVGFPKIPGVRFPTVIQRPSRNDYGPDFAAKRIITIEPPKWIGDYKVLAPKGDSDGNDLGMLLPPEVAAPLGTYTGWNLRRKSIGADGALANLQGSFIPFPITDKTGDPRPTVQRRYANVKIYRGDLDDACGRLIQAGYLLAEDRDAYLAYGTALWDFVTKK